MIRGTTLFVCDECKKKFMAPDIEWRATIFSQPMPCPQCDSYHTSPRSLFGINKVAYRQIWAQIDRAKK